MGRTDKIKRETLEQPGSALGTPKSANRHTAGIEAQRARSDLREEQCRAQHGNILQEHRHLKLLHHGIFHGPEIVHHESHRNGKEHQQPCADFSMKAEKNAPPTMAMMPEAGTKTLAVGTPCEAA